MPDLPGRISSPGGNARPSLRAGSDPDRSSAEPPQSEPAASPPGSDTENADREACATIAAADDPLTVRLYGMKDVTLPAYLLMWSGGVLLGMGVIALSFESLRPTTELGELLSRQLQREPWLQVAARWTPQAVLAGIVFELIEGIVVLLAFRRAARQQRRSARRR